MEWHSSRARFCFSFFGGADELLQLPRASLAPVIAERRALASLATRYFQEEVARADACVAAFFDYAARVFPQVGEALSLCYGVRKYDVFMSCQTRTRWQRQMLSENPNSISCFGTSSLLNERQVTLSDEQGVRARL